MSFRCDLLDAAIAEKVLKALQTAEIEQALAALQELESREPKACPMGISLIA
jgi:hypothetical protein